MSPTPEPDRTSRLGKWIDLVWRSPSALSIWRGLGLGLAAGLWTAVVMETWTSFDVPGLGVWAKMLLILEGLASDTTGPLTSSWWFVAFILGCAVALGRGFTSFWGSVKLTIALMAALAAACIAGTLISQSAVAQSYAKTFNLAYPDSSLAFRLFVWHDIFHARWFVGLLLALSLNLVVCTLRRWVKTWNVIKRPAAERGRKVPIKQAPLAAFQSDRPVAETRSLAEGFFGRVFRRAQVREVAGGTALYAERGRFSRLGMYLIHLSVLVIYAGAIIGLWFGFRGDMQVWEDDSNRVYLAADGRRHGLPFMVFLDRFQLVCNPDQPDHVDQYRSLVVVVEPLTAGVDDPDWPLESLRVVDGWGFWPGVIEVNLRMFHRGVAFLQSSWGAVARGVVLRITDTLGRERTVRLPFRSQRQGMLHQPLHLRDLGVALVVNRVAGSERCRPTAVVNLIRFVPGRRGHQRFVVRMRPGEQLVVPTSRACALRPGTTDQMAAAMYACLGWARDYTISLDKVDVRYYTVLTVAYSPGVWLVWVGSGLMVLGFIWSFYFSHRKVWLVVRPEGQGSRVEIFGATNKHQYGLKLWAGRLAERLRRRLDEGGTAS